MKRLLIAALVLISAVACRQNPPPADVTPASPGPEGAFNLRSNQVRTRHLVDGSVTAGKIAVVAVVVNVTNGTASASSAAAPTLAGGVLLACRSAGNQDQFMDNVVLNGDGSVTVTLAANATATNNFVCNVLKANGFGIS